MTPPAGFGPTAVGEAALVATDQGMAALGALVHAGRRVAVGPTGLLVGRASHCDLVLDVDGVSREHARIDADDGRFALADLGSRNGTWLDGQRVETPVSLRPGAEIVIAGERLLWLAGDATQVAPPPAASAAADATERVVGFDGGRLTIGRDPSNDVALEDRNVSRWHAEVVARDGRVELRDLGSRNGTWVDGQIALRAELRTGSEIRIGSYRLTFDGTGFRARDARCDARLDARELSVAVRGRTLVQPTSLSVEPRELVAVIGRSGSGKTTLVKALAGVIAPSAGAVTLAGDPLGDRRTDVGYVPQDEIVHPLLTVREALRYAARLRLPLDLDAHELEIVVQRTLEELAMEHRAEHRIATLSGGERKRAGVAVELLGKPSVLFLDEPTTGLDPALEARTMRLLRGLADGDRAVVVVTHATRSLELCDRLALVGPGGKLAFFGPPDEALASFGVEHFDDLYDAVESPTPAVPPRAPPARAPGGDRQLPRPPGPRRGSWLAQTAVLTRRYARLVVRDRRNLAILLGQVPLLGLAIGALFSNDVFDPGRDGNANDAAQVLFLLVTTTFWLGAIAAAREIIKERAIVAREAAAGVRLSSYLASKAAVLFTLAAVQATALAAVVLAVGPLHEPAGTYVIVVGLVVATALVAVASGLVISAIARSQDQAPSYIPLLLVPQLLFAGAIVPLTKMGPLLEAFSTVVPSRWAFAAIGTAVDMNGRIGVDPIDARRSAYGSDFFATGAAEGFAVLAAFLIMLLAVVALLLARRAADAR